ncbi:MAG TPA: methyltransferase domain-containing protein [Rickettsiales bacterium]|nr:methyltransferase domain-containing protein [Rickettsiales bacterium]
MEKIKKLNYRDYEEIIVILPEGDNTIFINGLEAEIFRLIRMNISKKEMFSHIKQNISYIEFAEYLNNFINKLNSVMDKTNKENSNKDFYNSAGITDINDPLKPNISNFAVERFYNEFKKVIKKGDEILDLGCNAGRFSFFCEEKFGANVLGIDFSDIAINYAKKAAEIKKSKCKFEVKDYNNLNFNKKFNVVIFPNNIIECSYSEFENICKQVKNILKTNGKFILSCPITRNYNKYLNQQGSCNNFITIPEKGKFDYQTYFYNSGFINYILSKFFQVETFKILNYKDRNNKDTKNCFFVAQKF